MEVTVKDLAGLSLEDVARHIRDAVEREEQRIDDYTASMNHVEMLVIATGARVVYVKEGKPNWAEVMGFTKTVLTQSLSHGPAIKDVYYLKYANGCSGSHPAEQVFLTMKDASESIFGKL